MPAMLVLLALATALVSQKGRGEAGLPAATPKGQALEGTQNNQQFGWAVDLTKQGTVMAVGARGANSFEGAVRVYRLTGGSWVQLGADINGKPIPLSRERENFGWSVSVSEADGIIRVAVGAPGAGMPAGSGRRSGSVRVYDWSDSASTWVQVGNDITQGVLPNKTSFQEFGRSVSLSANGSRVAVGAPFNDDNGPVSGIVRLYDWSDSASTWVQVGDAIVGKAEGDEAGQSVSLSADGSRVAVGAAPTLNFDLDPLSGSVRLFDWSDSASTWVQVGGDIDGEVAGDLFGKSVSLSAEGSRVAVGAPGNSRFVDGGYVKVYGLTNGVWTQLGTDINGEAAIDGFGNSVSLSANGNRVAVGAPGGGSSSASGSILVFEYIGEDWAQVCADINGENAGDFYGRGLALSADGACIAGGAPGYDNDAGSDVGQVRVFTCPREEMAGDPFVSLPNHRDPVFIDMPTDGSFTVLVAHDLNFTIAASAFHLPDDPPDVTYLHTIRFVQDAHPAVDLVADAVRGGLILRVEGEAGERGVLPRERLVLPGGIAVTCTGDASATMHDGTHPASCVVESRVGDVVEVSCATASSKFAESAEAQHRAHLDLRIVSLGATAARGAFAAAAAS